MFLGISGQVEYALAREVAFLFLLSLIDVENCDKNEALGDVSYAKTSKFAYPTSGSKSRFRRFLNN